MQRQLQAPFNFRSAVLVPRTPIRGTGQKVPISAYQKQNSTPEFAADRRQAILALLAVPAMVLASPDGAQAVGFNKDPRQLLREKEARKAKLKEAAAAMRTKGKTEDAFEDSKYSLPEEARTPNLRTLSDERLREN